MQKNTYLNIVLTLLLLLCACALFFIVNATDNLRFAVEDLKKSIRSIDSSLAAAKTTRGVASDDAGLKDKRNDSAPAPREKLANAEYYDPDAERGDRLVSALSADIGNMNPLISNEYDSRVIYSKTMSSLAEQDYASRGDAPFKPAMAESWSVSPDKLSYRIKLRKGIYWHDFKDPVTGREWKNVEVTARDFKFYVDAVKNKDVDCAPIRTYLADLEGLEVVNDYEFIVKWKKPYFLSEDLTFSLSPLPAHLYHAYDGPFDGKRFNDDNARNRMIVGCGPYKFERWEKGRRVVLSRANNFYGSAYGLTPPIDTLQFDIIMHPNTRLQALLSRELDKLDLTPDQWMNRTGSKEFGPEGHLRKFTLKSGMYNYIGLNQKNELFKDRRTRVALSHLVDREKILRDVYFGLGEAVSGPFSSKSSSCDKNIRPYPFSMEKAKKFFAEAGWKDSDGDGVLDKNGRKFVFTVIYPNMPIYQKMLAMIKEDMAKAGVMMELLGIEWSVLLQRIEKKQFDACALGWTSSLKPDPFQLWHSSQADLKASSNHIGFKNAEADRLIEKIRVEFDPLERTRLYHAFHKLIHEEAPYLFLIARSDLRALDKRYKNVRMFPEGPVDEIMWTPADRQLATPGF